MVSTLFYSFYFLHQGLSLSDKFKFPFVAHRFCSDVVSTLSVNDVLL